MSIVRFIGIVALLFAMSIGMSCGGGGGHEPTFVIPGTVTLDGVGLSGVTMTLFDECSGGPIPSACTPHVAAITTTDSNGNYQFVAGVSFYTISPAKDGFNFTPEYLRIAVSSVGTAILEPLGGASGLNFTAHKSGA